MTTNKQKSELRSTVLASQARLSEEERFQKSLCICELLSASDLLSAEVKMAFCFKSYRNELDTEPVISLLRSRGIAVCFPRIEVEAEAARIETGMKTGEAGIVNTNGEAFDKGKRRSMNLYEAVDGEKDFAIGAYGIREPIPERCRRVMPSEVDFILVPGVAFDRSLNRLGYGGGYYDRFFPQTRDKCVKAALAFAMQIVENVPVDQYDTRMDYLITEEGILKSI